MQEKEYHTIVHATPRNNISPAPLKPENFHHYLRTEIRQATRIVMEGIMCEELSGFPGAKWGESTSECIG